MHPEFVFINYVLNIFFPSNGQPRGCYYIQNILKLIASVIPSTVQAPLPHLLVYLLHLWKRRLLSETPEQVCPSL